MPEDQALYVRTGDAFVGTACTRNAWNPRHQSGGAVLALLGHVLEDVPVATPMSLSRLTVDLVRPVPIGEELRVEQEVLREGRTIQVVDATVRTADTVLCRSRALRIRDADLTGGPVLESTTDDAWLADVPGPEGLENFDDVPSTADFLRVATEFRRTAGGEPGVAWVRLRVPVVAGEAVRATSRTTVALDLVNLIGIRGLPPGVTGINPDVTGHVVRPPVGEWIGLVGSTRVAPSIGHGFSMATLIDHEGAFGVSSTSQVVQRHDSYTPRA